MLHKKGLTIGALCFLQLFLAPDPSPAQSEASPAVSLPFFGTIAKAGAVWTPGVKTVVVDAGHGGKDYGAISKRGTREKDVNLAVAKYLKHYLEERGLRVIMTRDSDVFIPLPVRAKIANKKKADFFVSIHANASTSDSLKGFEVYYLSEATDDYALALERAENSERLSPSLNRFDLSNSLKTIYWELLEFSNRRQSLSMADFIQKEVRRNANVGPQRIKEAQFYVLKWTECPSVLIETGYLTNKDDEARLAQDGYRQVLARAFADGIMAYKQQIEKSNS